MIEQGPFYLSWKAPRRILDCELPATGALFGYGIEGYLIASALAFSKGLDTGFVRSVPKSHGLKAEVEGELPPCAYHGLVDLRGDAPSHVRSLFTDVLKWYPSKSSSDDLITLPRPLCPADLEEAKSKIRILHGDFKLSSGSRSPAYVDSVPVSQSYSSALTAAAVAKELLGPVGIIVAPPYGGISLGVMLALLTGAELRIPRLESLESKLPRGALLRGETELRSAVFVDDFYSTGSTVSRALGAAEVQVRVFATCASEGALVRSGDSLCALFMSRSGSVDVTSAARSAVSA